MPGVPLTVATMPDVFSTYWLNVGMLVKNDVYSYQQHAKKLPDELTIIDGSIENLVLEKDGIGWEAKAAGTIDQVSLYARVYSESQGFVLQWEVNGPAHQPRVVLPNIPTTIPVGDLAARSFFSASSNAVTLYSQILERSYSDGYSDCLPYPNLTTVPDEWIELRLTSTLEL